MRREESITTIRFLSLKLHDLLRGEGVPRDKETSDPTLRFFNHLSIMLNLNGDLVPAVTGKITKDTALATVAVSSNSNPKTKTVLPYMATEIIPSNMELRDLSNPSR